MRDSIMVEDDSSGSGGGLGGLWLGVLGPPVIWAIRIATSYILVPYACWWGWMPVMNGVTLAALLGTVAIGWLAWRRWREAGRGVEVESGGRTARTRFMALVGMLGSGFFFLVIVAEGLANFLVDPCQTGGAPLP